MLEPRRVLVVDDDESVASFFEESLRNEGYEVHVATEGGRALTLAHELSQRGLDLHVVLLDLGLPGWRPALPLIPHLRESHPFVEFVIITGGFEASRTDIILEAFREYDVCDFLEKPVDLLKLQISIKRAYRQSAARLRVKESHRELVERNQEQTRELKKLERRMLDFRASSLRAKLGRISGERISEHILDVGLRLLSAVDVDQLLEIAIDAIQKVVPTAATAVFFCKGFEDRTPGASEPEEYLSCLTHRTHMRRNELPEDLLEKIGLRIADETIAGAQSVRLPSRVPVGARSREGVGDLVRSVHSLLCVPLVDSELRILGVVMLFNRATGDGRIASQGFSDGDVRVVEAIAGFLACGVVREHEIGVDPLTKIPNRRVLRRRVEDEIETLVKQDRADDVGIWFGVLDVDYFRVYNKIAGHLAGDSVLRSVARTIEESLRDHDLVARFGGEEFCIVLKRVEDEESARAIFDRIRVGISRLPVPNHAQMPFGSVTASIGATRLCRKDTFELVFERADRALKPLKRSEETRNAIAIEATPCD